MHDYLFRLWTKKGISREAKDKKSYEIAFCQHIAFAISHLSYIHAWSQRANIHTKPYEILYTHQDAVITMEWQTLATELLEEAC